MAEAGRHRLLQLSCRADQPASPRRIPRYGRQRLAAGPPPTQPKVHREPGTGARACRNLAPQTAHPAPLAQPAVCRHAPEVGAVCGKAARTVLCGGRTAMSVPTATAPATLQHAMPLTRAVPTRTARWVLTAWASRLRRRGPAPA